MLPEETFGHRYASGERGRINASIAPPDPGTVYFFYPAYVESLFVRPGPLAPAASGDSLAPVEVLIEGAFSDGCTELHAANQSRAGHLLDLELITRRPRGEACARVERPYRLYLMLDGRYEPGNYLLKVNGAPFTFEIRRPTSENS